MSAIVWALLGVFAGYWERLRADEILVLAVGAFAVGSMGSLALYSLFRELRHLYVRGRVISLIADVPRILAIGNYPSRARAVDDWRKLTGIPRAIQIHVLALQGDLISAEADRLEALLPTLRDWC